MTRPVRLEGGMCDGWTVPWPDHGAVEHYRHPDRPDEFHRYQIKLGDPDVATYQRPLLDAEAAALERLFKAEMEDET